MKTKEEIFAAAKEVVAKEMGYPDWETCLNDQPNYMVEKICDRAAFVAMEDYRNQPPISREELRKEFKDTFCSGTTIEASEHRVFNWFWENMTTGVDGVAGLIEKYTAELKDAENYSGPNWEMKKTACKKILKDLSALPASKPIVDGADIRNKLAPFKNLLALIDIADIRLNNDKYELLLQELEQCRANIDYLSNLPGKSEWVKENSNVRVDFENNKNTMRVNCLDEHNSEFLVEVKKRYKATYSMTIEEAQELIVFLQSHIRNSE